MLPVIIELKHKRWIHSTDRQEALAESLCSEVAFCDPCHFQTASGKSVALAASRAVAIGTQFKEPPAKPSKRCGRGGFEDAKAQRERGLSA